MTEQRPIRERLRELAEKATDPPWQAYIAYSGESGLPDEVGIYAGAATTRSGENTIISDFVSRSENILPDLELIVEAVNALPALLDHLEALERRVRAAEEALREVLALWDDDVPDPDDVERDVLVPARAALSALSALSEARSLITEGQK